MSSPVALQELLTAIRTSWTADTSSRRDQWSPNNPARGQCVVSALLILDYFGGELRRYETEYQGQKEKHFTNVLADGQEIDSARDQYPANYTRAISNPNLGQFNCLREKMLNDSDTKRRYLLLKQLTVQKISQEVTYE